MAKILVVDDETDLEVLIKQKFRKEIRQKEYEFLFAINGRDALEKIQADPEVDVVLSDINMPEMNGIELTRRIASSNLSTNVLILSMYNDEAYILKSIEAGVMGYLPKDADYEDIIKGVREIAAGNLYYSAQVTRILTDSIIKTPRALGRSKKEIPLTKRESQILDGIVKGCSNKIIAEDLFISTRTVDTHRNNIMKKLKARNTADLVRIAIENTLI